MIDFPMATAQRLTIAIPVASQCALHVAVEVFGWCATRVGEFVEAPLRWFGIFIGAFFAL